jgi:hypothetical protein
MKSAPDGASSLIRQVVRGDCSWEALKQIGVRLEFTDAGLELRYSGAAAAYPDANDIAAGFWRYQFDQDALRTWASVVLAGSGFIDLASLEGTFVGDTLLDALWDAAQSGELSPTARLAVRQLLHP